MTSAPQPTSQKPPRVFISYSWSGPEYENWVLQLAEKLMSKGVHVTIDKWDLHVGHDKYHFMEQMVNDPEIAKVLVFCDEKYQAKADARSGGVGVEGTIMSSAVYNKVQQDKFIPIVAERGPAGQTYLPTFMASRIYIDLSNQDTFDAEWDKLLRNIYGRPLHQRPPMGLPPSELFVEQPTLSTTSMVTRIRGALAAGQDVRGMADDYFRTFFHGVQAINGDSGTAEHWDDKVMNMVGEYLPYRDDLVDFVSLLATHVNKRWVADALGGFLEQFLALSELGQHNGNDTKDHLQFMAYETFLYVVGTLVGRGRLRAVSRLLNRTYVVSDDRGAVPHSFDVFDTRIHSLDETRNRRLQMNRLSVVADTVKERAFREDISFRHLVQLDYILCLRSAITESAKWFPYLSPYVYRLGQQELFSRAKSDEGWKNLSVLLGGTATRLMEVFADRQSYLHKVMRCQFGTDVYWPEKGYLNWSAIERRAKLERRSGKPKQPPD